MKKTNGFIATSLLYSFFLAFITVFVAMLAIYLQNRVYLDKLEDSSKNFIYIREMPKSGSFNVYFDGSASPKSCSFVPDTENDFNCVGTVYTFAKCQTIHREGNNFYVKECS